MAYNGYLLKIGKYEIQSDTQMKTGSYKAYINMQDVDDWTDADGKLHRNVLDSKPPKVEFETPDMLTEIEFRNLIKGIYDNFTDKTKKEALVTMYVPELGEYVVERCYMVDIQPQMYSIFGDTIRYSSVRFSFVGGLADE